jgi:CRISPR-associated protein Cmr1
MQFLTPAFLGNAGQTAQWRTPPIKAQLRQWWRVVYAADQPGGVDVATMRQAEGRLFGVAADTHGDSRKSQVRLRLSDWREGSLKSWEGLEQGAVHHPEVERAGYKVGPHVYLGFGPLTVVGKATVLTKERAAIQAKDSAVLRLAVPAGVDGKRLQRALALMNLYGTLGGRSRNGWGSFSLTPMDGTPALSPALDHSVTLPWRDALSTDWAQAIGTKDDQPLIWQTGPFDDWKRAMVQLAKTKIELRTQFRFPQDRPDGQIHERHWLSYPVTRHDVAAWKRDNLRLPNSLRFKVRPSADGKSVHGVVFHMPCRPPAAFRPDPRALERVWTKVHEYLDQPTSNVKRIAA